MFTKPTSRIHVTDTHTHRHRYTPRHAPRHAVWSASVFLRSFIHSSPAALASFVVIIMLLCLCPALPFLPATTSSHALLFCATGSII